MKTASTKSTSNTQKIRYPLMILGSSLLILFIVKFYSLHHWHEKEMYKTVSLKVNQASPFLSSDDAGFNYIFTQYGTWECFECSNAKTVCEANAYVNFEECKAKYCDVFQGPYYPPQEWEGCIQNCGYDYQQEYNSCYYAERTCISQCIKHSRSL